MKILFTAFNGKNNSSKILLDMLNQENKLYLKNSFKTSTIQLEKHLSTNKYDLIISFGQAPLNKDTIKIETVGRNDIEYKTKYNYEPLIKKMNKNFEILISNDAGNYLCNNIYFYGLKFIEKHNLKTNMIFIHIPIINNITNIDCLSNIFSQL